MRLRDAGVMGDRMSRADDRNVRPESFMASISSGVATHPGGHRPGAGAIPALAKIAWHSRRRRLHSERLSFANSAGIVIPRETWW